MAPPEKGLKALTAGTRLNFIVAGGVLIVLLALGPIIMRAEGLLSSNPLRPLAVGAMSKFGFRHQGTPTPGVPFSGPAGEMTLARFRGQAVLVNLWASWCVPCVTELPSLDALQARLGGPRFQVVAINMDADADDALYFLAKNKIHNLRLYSDPHLLMSIAWQEPGIPVSVLYDDKGREIGRYVGGTDWASPEAVALIAQAIAPAKEK